MKNDSKTVLVVGGATGIGQAIAADHAERALVWSRRHGVDATDEASVQQAVDELLATAGPPWALVHTVGPFAETPLLETSVDGYRELLEANLTSAFLMTRALVPAMCAAGCGRVLLFTAASTETSRAMRRAPVYFAAKAAVASLSRSLAAEAAPHGVTVNCIAPGIIEHEHSHQESQERMRSKVPMGRAGTAADLLPLVRLLLGDGGSYITGQSFTVDGGLSL